MNDVRQLVWFVEETMLYHLRRCPARTVERGREKIVKYLGLSKSNVASISFPYKKVKTKFFFYRMIEKMELYFSMLFDPTSANIIVINFRCELILCKT